MDQKLIQDDQDSYGSTDSMEEPPVLNMDNLGENIEKIQKNCRFLEKASNTIGTTKDNRELRAKIEYTLHESKTLVAETNKQIQPLVLANYKKDATCKLQVQRLKDNFVEAVSAFSSLQLDLKMKLQRNLPTVPCPITHTERRSVDYLYDDDEQVTSKQSYQKTLQDQGEIIEREDRFYQIENDITDINEIMRELGNLTTTHGDAIQSIENAVNSAYNDVERGRRELEKATARSHRGYRNLICLFVILLLIMAATAVMLFFTLKPN